jgi:hypothetical protein
MPHWFELANKPLRSQSAWDNDFGVNVQLVSNRQIKPPRKSALDKDFGVNALVLLKQNLNAGMARTLDDSRNLDFKRSRQPLVNIYIADTLWIRWPRTRLESAVGNKPALLNPICVL